MADTTQAIISIVPPVLATGLALYTFGAIERMGGFPARTEEVRLSDMKIKGLQDIL
jgi:hypothetical protein